MMTALGNRRCNAIFERAVPASKEVLRPKGDKASMKQRQIWIQNKYVTRAYLFPASSSSEDDAPLAKDAANARLMRAVATNASDQVLFCLSRGADVNAQVMFTIDVIGATSPADDISDFTAAVTIPLQLAPMLMAPLDVASQLGHLSVMECLIANGAVIDAPGARTPLTAAIEHGQAAAVCSLLKHDASLARPPALDLSLEFQNPDIITLLRLASLQVLPHLLANSSHPLCSKRPVMRIVRTGPGISAPLYSNFQLTFIQISRSLF